MPGRDQEPSFQLASGTINERDYSYNISNTLGSIFYNTDTSNVEIRHEDPSNTLGWRDLVMNNKEQIDISGKLVVNGDVSLNGGLTVSSGPSANGKCILTLEADTDNGVLSSNELAVPQILFKQDGGFIFSAVGVNIDPADGNRLSIVNSANANNSGISFSTGTTDGAQGSGTKGYELATERMRIAGDGNVGIGTVTPDFPLDIAITETGASNIARTFMNNSNTTIGNPGSNWQNDNVSINCVGDIHAGTYIAASDVRIKRDIMDLPSTLALIEQIKPKTYKFINPKRGDKMAYGFIAQDLEEVLPCIVKTKKNKIPNVMKTADVIDGVFTLEEATDLIEGDEIAIFEEDDTELKVKITELISDKQFKVEMETELKDKYFIYGKFVNDFKSVEHNCLLPIMIKSIQELNAKNKSLEERLDVKSNQELVERIETLKTENTEQKTDISFIKTENTELKAQIIQLKTDISMIRNHIGI